MCGLNALKSVLRLRFLLGEMFLDFIYIFKWTIQTAKCAIPTCPIAPTKSLTQPSCSTMAITHPTNAQQDQSLLRTSTPIARLSPTSTLTALCSRQEFTTLRIKRVTRKASTPKEWPLKLSFPTPPSKTVSLFSKGLLSNLQFVNT